MRHEVLECSGISWTTCKQSSCRSGQITAPTPHRSVFTCRTSFLQPNQQCQSTVRQNQSKQVTPNYQPNSFAIEVSYLRDNPCPALYTAAKCTPQHTHNSLTALFLGLPGWAGTRKVKPIWILLKQETVSGSALPAAQPTASKH